MKRKDVQLEHLGGVLLDNLIEVHCKSEVTYKSSHRTLRCRLPHVVNLYVHIVARILLNWMRRQCRSLSVVCLYQSC